MHLIFFSLNQGILFLFAMCFYFVKY